VLTYDAQNASSNYGWEWKSEMDAIQAAYDAVMKGEQPVYPRGDRELRHLMVKDGEVEQILQEQDASGAWIDKEGSIRDAESKKVTPQSGVIHSDDFVKQVRTLSAWLLARRVE
jgi:hypothetical protein